ncbi:hypothetical protein GUJ93_ZPchr0013g35782 [Zizania palustris]|uniref:Uncharacterized protein n=1 Tax=Zizania palustris TaxID=103762 RepID=A0A8J5WNN2_ZIZPA|nr:hypothetical protein GUJ93_ZPchr0012g21496 [Zizania palustris]KAG8098902.1 hypothetical protein GUJ93_ZPchr0013g35782 [Zizania palustris]
MRQLSPAVRDPQRLRLARTVHSRLTQRLPKAAREQPTALTRAVRCRLTVLARMARPTRDRDTANVPWFWKEARSATYQNFIDASRKEAAQQ